MPYPENPAYRLARHISVFCVTNQRSSFAMILFCSQKLNPNGESPNGRVEFPEVVDLDCRYPASILKDLLFPLFEKDRPFRFTEKKCVKLHARKKVGLETFDDVLRRTGHALDLHGTSQVAKTGPPAARIGFRVQFTDQDLTLGSHNSCQLARHHPQLLNVIEGK